MVTNELLTFIRDERAKGVSDMAIKTLLCENTWLPSDIDEAFATLASGFAVALSRPAPKKLNGGVFILAVFGLLFLITYLGPGLFIFSGGGTFVIILILAIAVVASFFRKMNAASKSAEARHGGVRAFLTFLATIGALGITFIFIIILLIASGGIRLDF